MAVSRDDPYRGFNFLVDLGDGETEGPAAGFQEVSGLGIEVTAVEYRNGNERYNAPRKLFGLAKYPDAVLRRGVTGDLRLYRWIDDVRNGAPNAVRTVGIQLLDEERAKVVTWVLHRAWPRKYTGPAPSGKGRDVAIEELVLAYERLEME